MLEKISPEQKHLSAIPLTENLIWEMIRNKGIKRKT